jgi:hypothetical protein
MITARRTSRPEYLTLLALFGSLLGLRVWGIGSRFWLLEDQIRDWNIVLGSFRELPLVGPPTHVHGYTIGPSFYWILWAIRVVVGPWFNNLPHAGGIGQAVLHSAADALLCLAVWRRAGSMAGALAGAVLIGTAAYDLCFAALVWNPTMGTTLAKVAIALVLFDWHRRGVARAAATFAVAWMAVHAYTGASFVTLGVFVAALLDPLRRGERTVMLRNAAAIAGVVAILQIPYVLFQLKTSFDQPAMGAVTGSVMQVLTGHGQTQLSASAAKYVEAVTFVQAGPWAAPWMPWLLAASALIVIVRYWRDTALLSVLLVPGITAIFGYALFQASLDNYYYLSLMPSAVLTAVFAALALPWPRPRMAVAIVLLAASIALVPPRVRLSTTYHRLPEYGAIVSGSRVVAQRGMAMRSVRTAFASPATCDPEFVYRILGGRIDRTSPWVAVIGDDGSVSYREVEPL